MKFKHRLFAHTFKLTMLVLVALVATGCGDDDPVGVGGGVQVDQITIALNSLAVHHDCDGLLVGDGEFNYSFAVWKRSNPEESWAKVKSWGEKAVTLGDGDTKNITDRSVSIELPRQKGPQFKVEWSVRENDGILGDDFTKKVSFVHEYVGNQPWAPSGNSFAEYSASSQIGKVITKIVQRRDECEFTVTYSVVFETM